MKKVVLFAALTAVLFLLGCGGGSPGMPPFQATGTSAMIQTGDATNGQIVKFELTINSIVLKGVSPTMDTGNLLAGPAEVEFVHEAGIMEPLTLAHVPPGTYSGATLTVSNPEVVVINGTTPAKVPATLSSSTVNVSFSSNITVGTTPLFINFDLNLATSVTLNGSPVTSATVNPQFTVTTATVPPNGEGEDDDNGEIEDLHGTVKSVTPPTFIITTNSGDVTFTTDSNTRFEDGISSLSDLKTGDVVEVSGVTQSDGTKLATKVEREEQAEGEEAEGIISAVTGSPATSLTIVHQVDSLNSTSPPVTVDVTITPTTVFVVRADRLSISAPAFDASHIGKGQRIEVDSSTTTSPLMATRIKLREQAIVGTVAATPAPTATGFTLNIDPASAFGMLSGMTSIAVTIPPGASLEVMPVAGATIRVRGLVFVNGTTDTMIVTHDDNND